MIIDKKSVVKWPFKNSFSEEPSLNTPLTTVIYWKLLLNSFISVVFFYFAMVIEITVVESLFFLISLFFVLAHYC
jgi:hypothetical protein